jgi:hypothetical protein
MHHRRSRPFRLLGRNRVSPVRPPGAFTCRRRAADPAVGKQIGWAQQRSNALFDRCATPAISRASSPNSKHTGEWRDAESGANEA